MKPFKYFITFYILFFRLNKVFDYFLSETFANQPNDHNNVEEEEEATISLSIPIMKQEHNSGEIYILESDDDTFQTKVEPESINETQTPMDVEMQLEDNFSSSVNEFASNNSNALSVGMEPTGNNSNVRAVRKEKRKKTQWSYRTRNKIPTTCDVCKAEFKTPIALIKHRGIHFDQFDFHCRICLLRFFRKFDRNCHEEKCKKRVYECYICHYIFQSSAVVERHLRVHTDMTSYVLSKAMRKRFIEKNAKSRKIGKKYVATKKAIKMEKMKNMEKMQTQCIGLIDLTED